MDIMKILKQGLLGLLMIVAMAILAACSGKEGANDNPLIMDGNKEEATADWGWSEALFNKLEQEEVTSKSIDMPVISIETDDTSDGAWDFVTQPVAPLVSRQVASWTPDYVMPPEPYNVKCRITVTDSDKNVVLDGAEAKVRVRGNWTTNYDKKPLGIKFEEKQNILGLNEGRKYKNWVLLAEYKDGSMLRNRTALSIAKEILAPDGLYAADARLVGVKINNKYWGVYLLTELQQVNKGRVAVTEPDKDYQGTDIGYFLEFDGYFYEEDDLHSFHVGYADNAPLIPFDGKGGSGKTMSCLPQNAWDPKSDVGITIKSDIYSMEQRNFVAGFVEGVYKIMYEAAYNQAAYVFTEDYKSLVKSDDPGLSPEAAVRRVVNLDSLADMYILSELTCDADIYWSSFYMSADFGPEGDKRLTFQAPWDFDSALGNKSRCPDGTGFYAGNIVPDVNAGTVNGGSYETVNPWLVVLVNQDWFMGLVKDKWTRAYDGGVFDRACSLIETETVSYKADFTRNYGKWHNLSNNGAYVGELSPRAAECKTHAKAAGYLEDWLKARVSFMNKHYHN